MLFRSRFVPSFHHDFESSFLHCYFLLLICPLITATMIITVKITTLTILTIRTITIFLPALFGRIAGLYDTNNFDENNENTSKTVSPDSDEISSPLPRSFYNSSFCSTGKKSYRSIDFADFGADFLPPGAFHFIIFCTLSSYFKISRFLF